MTAQSTRALTEPDRLGSGIDSLSISWLSTDGGAFVLSSDQYYTGILVSFEMIPDAATTTPTAAYTATLTRADGVDILHGLGVGSSTATATVSKVFGDGLGVVINSKLTLTIAAAGNAKGGIFNAYFLPL